MEETFGPSGSKIPSPENPKFEEYREALGKIAKERSVTPNPNDPKATLEAVKQSLKSSYAGAVEKTSKAQAELEAARKESSATTDAGTEKNEKDARNAIDFLDRTGISALGPKATEELLRKFGAAGCENGKPANLEKFLKGKNELAAEFRAFVTDALGMETGNVFDETTNPPILKSEIVNLASAFRGKGLLKEDGGLNSSAGVEETS
ncbi:MAG: hypothetical protein QG650_1159 [Patescibacteria group bacterium]|nr:hypothetical protein [Patescibacteria group bacterium]